MNLDNKVALVTGGASGLGQATVEKFVEKGAKTVILDINEDNGNKIIENLGEEILETYSRTKVETMNLNQILFF